MKKSSIVAWVLIGIDLLLSFITSLSSNGSLYQTPALSFDSFDSFLLSFFFFMGKHIFATIGILILVIGLISKKAKEIRAQRHSEHESAPAEISQIPENHIDPVIESSEIVLPTKKKKRPRTKRNLKPLWIALSALSAIVLLFFAYHLGFNSGVESGYAIGKLDGEDIGYENGYDNGYDDGFRSGKDVGYSNGEDAGYIVGFEECFEKVKSSIHSTLDQFGYIMFRDRNLESEYFQLKFFLEGK